MEELKQNIYSSMWTFLKVFGSADSQICSRSAHFREDVANVFFLFFLLALSSPFRSLLRFCDNAAGADTLGILIGHVTCWDISIRGVSPEARVDLSAPPALFSHSPVVWL